MELCAPRVSRLACGYLVVEVQLLHPRREPVVRVEETGPLTDQKGPRRPGHVSGHPSRGFTASSTLFGFSESQRDPGSPRPVVDFQLKSFQTVDFKIALVQFSALNQKL